MRSLPQAAQCARHADFRQEQWFQINPGAFLSLGEYLRLSDQLSFCPFMLQRSNDNRMIDSSQCNGLFDDTEFRIAAMALVRQSLQDVPQSRPGAERRGAIDTEPFGQLIGRLK